MLRRCSKGYRTTIVPARTGDILEGAVYVKYLDGTEEICRAGEMFYWPSGHTVRVEEDTSFVEFSPKRELKDVYDHIGRKLSAPE